MTLRYPYLSLAACTVWFMVQLSACQSTSQRDQPDFDVIYSSHDKKSRSLAEQLIALKGIDKKVKKNLDTKFASVVAHLPQSHRTRFYDALRRKVNMDTIRKKIVNIYTESLDQEQLSKLVAFYSSDLGQFITSTEPKLNSSIFDSLSDSSTQEAERILLQMIKEKDIPAKEARRAVYETTQSPTESVTPPPEIDDPIRKALDTLLFKD